MGESVKAEISVYRPELESFSVETPGGRIHIRWDNQASATPNAQLAFFAEFLATAGLYESWVSSCPLTYSSDNGFDELKNQWGWGGFTTQDMERCQSGARVVALVYNGWSWYGRAAKPEARMEAITSRAHAAGCRRPSHQTCRTDNAQSDDNARCPDSPYAVHRQYPCRS